MDDVDDTLVLRLLLRREMGEEGGEGGVSEEDAPRPMDLLSFWKNEGCERGERDNVRRAEAGQMGRYPGMT